MRYLDVQLFKAIIANNRHATLIVCNKIKEALKDLGQIRTEGFGVKFDLSAYELGLKELGSNKKVTHPNGVLRLLMNCSEYKNFTPAMLAFILGHEEATLALKSTGATTTDDEIFKIYWNTPNVLKLIQNDKVLKIIYAIGLNKKSAYTLEIPNEMVAHFKRHFRDCFKNLGKGSKPNQTKIKLITSALIISISQLTTEPNIIENKLRFVKESLDNYKPKKSAEKQQTTNEIERALVFAARHISQPSLKILGVMHYLYVNLADTKTIDTFDAALRANTHLFCIDDINAKNGRELFEAYVKQTADEENKEREKAIWNKQYADCAKLKIKEDKWEKNYQDGKKILAKYRTHAHLRDEKQPLHAKLKPLKKRSSIVNLGKSDSVANLNNVVRLKKLNGPKLIFSATPTNRLATISVNEISNSKSSTNDSIVMQRSASLKELKSIYSTTLPIPAAAPAERESEAVLVARQRERWGFDPMCRMNSTHLLPFLPKRIKDIEAIYGADDKTNSPRKPLAPAVRFFESSKTTTAPHTGYDQLLDMDEDTSLKHSF